MLSLQSVSKKYGTKLILDQVSLTVSPGEIVGLVGANGAGKTTLIKSILGLHSIDGGQILFRSDSEYQQQSEAMNAIGYLLDIELFDYLTAREHILLLGMYEGKNYTPQQMKEALGKVGLEDSLKKVKDYSYGMKQRLRLALAMMRPRDLLILDEPLLGLDITAIREFKAYLKGIAQSGVAIMLSSHQLSEIEDLIDRYLVLEEGKISMEVSGDSSSYQLTVEGNPKQLKDFHAFLDQESFAPSLELKDGKILVNTQADMNRILKEIYARDMQVAIEQVNVINQLFLEKGAKV